MSISELVKYEGDNQTFVWKYPHEDFNINSELIVHESQEAIFFANGQAADTFGPGRYKLDTSNIPILTKLVNIVTGVGVFHAEVYFINKTVQMAVKWGTDSKVRFIEPTLGVPIEIGASGEMNLSVSDGRKLLIKLVGTMNGIAWGDEREGFTKSLQSSFRPLISTAVKSNLSSAIKERNIDIIEVDNHLGDLSKTLCEKIEPGFEEYGLSIPGFYLTNIVLPEDDSGFKRLRDLHTITLQKKMAEAEADVKISQAESLASYKTVEAEAEARIKVAQRKAILEGETTETEVLKKETERQIIQAKADAEASRMAGFAEADVMRAQGYNQKDVIQADVQKAYAEGIGNMGSGPSGGNGGSLMGDILGMGVGMTAMGAIAPQIGKVMKDITRGSSDGTNEDNPNVLGDKICSKCGCSMPLKARFCLECGTELKTIMDDEIICPSCGEKTAKGKYCCNCGQPLIKKCQNCGAEIPLNGKFCSECGTGVDKEKSDEEE